MKRLVLLALAFFGLFYAARSMRNAQERTVAENRRQLLEAERAQAALTARLQEQPVPGLPELDQPDSLPRLPQSAANTHSVSPDLIAAGERLREEQRQSLEKVQEKMRYSYDCSRARQNLAVLTGVAQSGGAFQATKQVRDPAGGPERRGTLGAAERSQTRAELERFIAANCR